MLLRTRSGLQGVYIDLQLTCDLQRLPQWETEQDSCFTCLHNGIHRALKIFLKRWFCLTSQKIWGRSRSGPLGLMQSHVRGCNGVCWKDTWCGIFWVDPWIEGDSILSLWRSQAPSLWKTQWAGSQSGVHQPVWTVRPLYPSPPTTDLGPMLTE